VDERPVGTVRVSGPRRGARRPTLIAIGLIAFVALAIIKPWAALGPASAPALASEAPAASAVALASPTAPPTPGLPPDPNGMTCLTDRATQVLTLQRDSRGEVRSWIVVPQATFDPADPRTPPIPLYSLHFIGLGICAGQIGPTDPTIELAPGAAEVWRATIVDVVAVHAVGSGATSEDLGAPQAITTRLDSASSAILYGPPLGAVPIPSGAPATDNIWAPGTYLLGYRFTTDQPTVIRWLRVVVVPTLGET